jgi:hypothetical protein
VLLSTRPTVARKQGGDRQVHSRYAETTHTFLTQPKLPPRSCRNTPRSNDQEILGHSMAAEGKTMEPSLQVDPKGIELIVGLIRKTVPQAAAAKAGDFYDPRFFSELRDSGFLKRLKREKS